MKLNQLADNPGARKGRMRVGRGIGSGKGKTCGRGVKGQKSRSGVAIKGFEGGQMPLHMRVPKRGFNKPNRLEFAEINLSTLQQAVDEKKLSDGETVTGARLVEAGVLRRTRDGVRVLGRGELKAKLALHVAGVTKTAQAAVEAAGGSVTIIAPVDARKTERTDAAKTRGEENRKGKWRKRRAPQASANA